MKLPHLNADPETLWKWFKVPKHDGAEVEIKLLTRSELRLLREANEAGGMAAEHTVIAQKFFRNFKGCEDSKGVEIPNTVEMRAAMMDDLFFGTFVSGKFAEIAGWVLEGKDVSGSGS